MKPLCKLMLVMLLSLTNAAVFSQKTDSQKTKIFSGYPQSIPLSKNTLQNIFAGTEGQSITISFTENFQFPGTVLSNEVKYSNLQCVIIRSSENKNSLFQISRITNSDKSISYSGRIINADAFDGYEIKKDSKNNYTFQKFETGKILQDCSY